ncbi:rad17 cell cycle checkpoint protein (macronuclear) [Tetrahymena thermophila SB210]|uniref:Rad17 cell cycle checkpoint protein n=1 Tax=Tetrahymena thermophila (strain SB210) TaxID=312017 RepID=W7XA78_TETTS|nr:rad17 cell cycle checkpoint protein [Tetrahymena thermophila SB210]EWS74252.1 rad17 cell cycle checkpoint protein [Tetrahymena thermophila SB210]|eukprot:XP_012653225.1 rad17 cell cycle checkpoint protein [Tetrahymena thermophila SB210]
MNNKNTYSDSESDDSESEDEDFINKFKNKQLIGQITELQNSNTQQNEEIRTDSENSANGFNFKSKIQEQTNQNGCFSRENSNNSILNSQNSQPLYIPAKKVKTNIKKILSDDSDEEDSHMKQSSHNNKVKNSEYNSSLNNSNSQLQSRKIMHSSSQNGHSFESKIQKQQQVVQREPAFPLLEVPSSQEDLVVSTKKYKEVEAFFNDLARGSKNILFLLGSSGIGKKTLISYIVEKKFKMQILHLNRMRKLQQSADNDMDDENSRALTNTSYLENPVDLLLYALSRSQSASLYKNEVIVMQELPENASFYDLKRISEFINTRYIKSRIKRNPLIFILNNSIYSPYQINKLFKDQCPEFYNNCTTEINLPRPSDKEIQQFIQKQMSNNIKFQALSGYQRNEIIQDIVNTANGDLSNALNQLRMASYSKIPSSLSIKNKKKGENQKEANKKEKQKDNEFTIFHTIGKFLYNKRKMKGSKEDPRQMTKEELLSGKTEFYFDPLKMIQQINCSQDFFRNSIQQNYLDFYANIEDVVNQANNYVLCDIFDRINFNEKYEIVKEENSYLSSLIVGQGVMLNNLNGKDVKKKYQSIAKSQLSNLETEKRQRKNALKKQIPYITLSKYVLEFNHHLSINPQVLAQDFVKLKGSWNQQKQIEENTNSIDSIGFDQLSDGANEQSLQFNKQNGLIPQKSIVVFRKEIIQKEIIEDDIEDCW